ncbi:MAG TPA: ATP-binding protein [Terriglobia bacterium]|nr:ATP-binding protein [Terriglobia bacterium]
MRRTDQAGSSGNRLDGAMTGAEEQGTSDLPTSRWADSMVVELDELIPSDPQNIDGVVGRVVDLLEENGCSQDLGDVQLALHEALTNAILHGNHSDPEKFVRLCVMIQEGGEILIVVKDSGSGFDPNKLPDPTLGENIYRESGRGVFLIQQLMDQVEYKFNDGTALIMRRHPPKSHP